MTTEEIFKKISSHMIKGLMIHDKMADYWDFLSLRGYKRMSEWHYKKESCSYRKLHRYYINHYHKLIEEENIDNPDIIPVSWYRYTRPEVDPATKAKAVKSGFEKWISWEKETKKAMQEYCSELANNGDVAASIFIGRYVDAVDHELKCAERIMLDLEAVSYDMPYIIGCQTKVHDKYKAKYDRY